MNIFDKIKLLNPFRCTGRDISYEEAINIINEHPNDAILIDVRSMQEYDEGHLNGAICIPLYDINKITNLVKNRDTIIILYCQYGIRSKKAAKVLKNLCYTNVYSICKGLDF